MICYHLSHLILGKKTNKCIFQTIICSSTENHVTATISVWDPRLEKKMIRTTDTFGISHGETWDILKSFDLLTVLMLAVKLLRVCSSRGKTNYGHNGLVLVAWNKSHPVCLVIDILKKQQKNKSKKKSGVREYLFSVLIEWLWQFDLNPPMLIARYSSLVCEKGVSPM